MPSTQLVLAYHSERPMPREELEVRFAAASRYVESLCVASVAQAHTLTQPHVGLAAWTLPDDTNRWPQIQIRGGEAAAWLYFPEHDARTQPDPLGFAAEVTAEDADVTRYGAPFACFHLNQGRLTISNDSLGLARCYEFEFEGLTIWATRPGLAHIFAGRPIHKAPTAWAGMATVGWNLNGVSHVGAGRQIPGRTRITAGPAGYIQRSFGYGQWINESRVHPPTWETATEGILNAMSIASYFELRPIADLSGGKDSRLLAAAALRSGVTNVVRTIRTDHGEVETAEQLVALYDGEIEHRIVEAGTSSRTSEESLPIHLSRAHRLYEGSYLPITAISGPPARGLSPSKVATFNGLGGESLQGGALYAGVWLDRLLGQGGDGALTRMTGMVNSPRGTSNHAKELALAAVRTRLELGQAQGIDGAYGLLNYFYNSERMPFWSNGFANRSMITPYYSSGLLPQVARTFWHGSDFPQFHKIMLADLVPAWCDVPFYKPVGTAKRAKKFFWEIYHWADLRNHIATRADKLDTFDSDGIMQVVAAVDSGEATKALEVALARFLWEDSIDPVLEDLNAQAARCQEDLTALRESDRSSTEEPSERPIP